MMQAQIQDKNSVAYQKLAWEALKKSINGLINKVLYSVATRLDKKCLIVQLHELDPKLPQSQVNVSNIGNIVQELFQENIVRGR